ncbi:MAG: pantoate--beta-alanine ligase [Candidatus Omnitrophota bacterium]
MPKCYLGIGSNLGKRQENIRRAIELLKQSGIKVKKVSTIIETEPMGGPPQGKFLNAVLEVDTRLKPHALLETLKNIEEQLGRKRTVRFGPRTIDLDILTYDSKSIKEKDLIVPHPRMHQRDFVLRPLKEIAPHMFKNPPKVVKTIKEMRQLTAKIKQQGKTIGFVPTMGYLHEGHLSLMRQAKHDCDVCVISIFVNPLQFGPQEDFRQYPRDFKRDELLAKGAGVDIIFCPEAKEMYPVEQLTLVNVERLSSGLCGASRPGHFKGVATVVTKLLNVVQPDFAYFGQKDFQQARIIQKMCADLNFPVEVKIMPIVREKDGLAMSSRNKYLSFQERKDALAVNESLEMAKEMVKHGQRSINVVQAAMREIIERKKTARIDYLAFVDADDLQPLKEIKGKMVIAAAVWFGTTRLIDNCLLTVR